MSETFETNEMAGGNTDSPACSKGIQCCFWFFTLNNPEVETLETFETVLKHECKWYIFQEETGENGTPHLQGTLCLKSKQRLSALKKINSSIHWEPTKSVNKSIEYCTKYETRTGRIYAYGIEIPEQVRVAEPRGWQLQVIEIFKKEPDDRTIHWFYEEKGNVGKTTLCKYLVVKYNALMLTGKSADMYHMISKFSSKRKIIIVDCPRSQQDYLNYGALEQIKNGLIFSGKYEGSQLVFNCPHIVCFANCEPDYEKMSSDRWNVVRIDC